MFGDRFLAVGVREPGIGEIEFACLGSGGTDVGFAAAELVNDRTDLRADDPHRGGGFAHVRAHEDAAARAIGVDVVERRRQHAGHPVGFRTFATVVVAGPDLPPPVPEAGAEDAAAVQGFVVDIRVGALRDHRLEVRRLQAGHTVLGHRQVRHAPQTDVAIGPRLSACPFDGVVIIFGFLNAEGRL
ncbi:hypothetical protein D3C87_1451940 [compost metagenome]